MASSHNETGYGCFWLRTWMCATLLLQLAQLPDRVVLQRQLTLLGDAPLDDIATRLQAMVTSGKWVRVKTIGYGVYSLFVGGVILSFAYSVREFCLSPT